MALVRATLARSCTVASGPELTDGIDMSERMWMAALGTLVIGVGLALTGCGGGGGGGSGSSSGGGTGVQGVLDIASGARVDSDYASLWRANGERWPAGSRGPVSVMVPSTTGGYLSATSGTRSSGFAYPEDVSDQYQVFLQAGDRYFLHCFPSDGVSLSDVQVSLELDGVPTHPGDACNRGGQVSISGDYRITMTADTGGPFRYVLTLSPQNTLASQQVAWPEPPLRLNEAIVTGDLAIASRMSTSGLTAGSSMTVVRPLGPDTWKVKRKAGVQAFSTLGNSDTRAETIEWIRGLREEFGLAAEPDYLMGTMAFTPNGNPGYSDIGMRWNLDQINIEGAWQLAPILGQGIGVAVMDTGMFSRDPDNGGAWHGDLADNTDATGDLDFVSAPYDVDNTNTPGRDSNPATPLTPANPVNTSFHGTHVAGIIAAVDNTIGTVGIASGATILPYRVLGVDPVDGEDGTGAVSDLIGAINHAAARSDVDVINLSLGGLPQIAALQQATDRAYNAGILVVAAAGNSGDASAVYPAANRRVLGVGATDQTGSRAGYSNYGQSVDLLAPGGSLNEGIYNAYGKVSASGALSDGYAYLSGSSMAAPHVTGVYALMKGAGSITPSQFRAWLIDGRLTNSHPSDPGYAADGAGLLDAEEALNSLSGLFPTVVSAWPRVAEIRPAGAPTEVLLEVLTDPASPVSPNITGTPDIPSALTVTDGEDRAITSGMPMPGSLIIRVNGTLPDRRPLSDEIRISYSTEGADRVLRVPVNVPSSDPMAERNAGIHYVLLLDANDHNSARSRQVTASYSQGSYRYSIRDVAPGDYILVAGSDLDNNGYICESGEACAEYPRTGAREVITIRDGQMSNRNMTTSFQRPGIAETRLPRYGFQGYPIPEHSSGSEPDRNLLPD